ncbi:SGNH/GDSL hydrolase family protein [Pseudomonas putida]|uniref:SGNH/GDSL hydrolase family protein n=1 Tax=Pseudomonas putida TaxID=303 RepID=UPI002363C077|nr:SGNH/GDSL hydrolase family protein [Pseudomonas putida]MDD1988158.1 SGNH/GDSL hydrolase family protein [Pseudomonas putida]HDS1793001.1 SGNH/GDSL hydrolase family protein [Pseudomonas putida]
MELKTYFAQDQHGDYMPGAQCRLYVRGTESLVSGLLQENGQPLSNPFNAASDARITLAAPNGLYDLRVTLGGRDYRFSVQFNDVAEDVEAARSSAAQAEIARDVAMASASIYATVAAGLAATDPGQYFSVPSPSGAEYLILYRNQAGVAVEVKRYPSAGAVSKTVKSFLTVAEMLADLSPEAGVRGIVTNDTVADNDGWYEKTGGSGSGGWLWLQDQPVSSKTADRLFQALDPSPLPRLAWTVGDGQGAHPLSLTRDGVTEADVLKTGQLLLQGAEELRSRGIHGVVMALLDMIDTSPWHIREDSTSVFTSIDTGTLLVEGINILDRWKSAQVASRSDMVMTADGLKPLYADAKKISGWGSSSLEYMGSLITQMLSEVAPGTNYYNGAKGGETSRAISSRLGAIPMLVSVSGGSIPESGGVTVTSSNVAPSAQMLAFTGTLAGVYGTLSSTSSTFTFTRATAGPAVAVANGTQFLPDIGPQHRDGMALLWMGKNDITTSDTFSDIAARTDASYDYFRAQIKRVLVFGHFGNSDWVGGPTSVPKLMQVNALHKARYGDHYVDTLSYLESPQVWTDTGVTPTSTDLAAQAGHCLPPSLTSDGLHFNAALNKAFIGFLKAKLISLGWFQ